MRTTRKTLAAIAVAFAATGVVVVISGSKAAAAAAAQDVAVCTLKVTGMTCGGCAAAVKSAAKQVDGVKEAAVSYEKGLADVTYDPAKTNPKAIAQAITERSGFKAEVQPPNRK